MTRARRRAADGRRPVAGALAAAAMAALTACSAGTDPDASSGESASASPSAEAALSAAASSAAVPSAAASSGAAATPAAPAARVIDVSFADGTVSGVEPRVAATVGERLVIRVTSDVADEVHVHGYDLLGDVPAGGTVEIPLTASIPGGFEVELEGLGKTLFQLRVA